MNAECEVDHREYSDGGATTVEEVDNTTLHAIYIMFIAAAFMIGGTINETYNIAQDGKRHIMQAHDGRFYVEEYKSWPHWERISDNLATKAEAQRIVTNVFRMPKEVK